MANTTDFDLVPADPVISPDDELEAALSGLVPDTQEDTQVPFGRGWGFDFETNSMLGETRGLATLQVWIEKTLRTARFSHLVYSDDYGTEGLLDVIGQVFSPGMASTIANGVKEALLVHDRISDVTNFVFDGDPSSSVLEVSFTVVTDEGDDLDLTLPTSILAGSV